MLEPIQRKRQQAVFLRIRLGNRTARLDIGDEISITGTMIDVEDRSMLWIATGSGKGAGGFSMFGSRSRGADDEALLGSIMSDVLGDSGEPLSTADAERA